MSILKQRVLVARAAILIMATCGLVTGYLLGRVLALQLAENGLDQYAKRTLVRDDASFLEASNLLSVLKDSQYPFCSEAEIAYFRELIFRSEYLRDAGRIQGGKIDCSTTAGHLVRPIGRFTPNSPKEDGLIPYSNLVPIRDASLKRAGLQLGTAYVVFGSHMPVDVDPFPMHLTLPLKEPARQQSDVTTGVTPGSAGPDQTTDGKVHLGDTLYATRCSTTHSDCVTASASVSDALHGEVEAIAGSTVVGGLIGIFFGIAFSSMYSRSRDLCQQLHRAVEKDKLRVVYRPIMSMASGQIVGAEALSRWDDEDGNPVGPEVFIKIAEEHGFIGTITKAVVQHCLRDFAETIRKHPGFRLSVNVSAADLTSPSFLPMLDDSLKRAKVTSRSLVIEITERSTAEGEVAMEAIRSLRRAGHSIHIDDFGTGHSNLDKLLYLFADTIKIDMAFTRVIGTDSVTVAILPQILAMAKSLGLDVVVEGVETEYQADYFTPATEKMYGQGWLYGHPVPVEEFLGVLAKSLHRGLAPSDLPATRTANAGGLHIVGA